MKIGPTLGIDVFYIGNFRFSNRFSIITSKMAFTENKFSHVSGKKYIFI